MQRKDKIDNIKTTLGEVKAILREHVQQKLDDSPSPAREKLLTPSLAKSSSSSAEVDPSSTLEVQKKFKEMNQKNAELEKHAGKFQKDEIKKKMEKKEFKENAVIASGITAGVLGFAGLLFVALRGSAGGAEPNVAPTSIPKP